MNCGNITSTHGSIGYNVHHVPENKDYANDGDDDDDNDDEGDDDDDICMTQRQVWVLFHPFD